MHIVSTLFIVGLTCHGALIFFSQQRLLDTMILVKLQRFSKSSSRLQDLQAF